MNSILKKIQEPRAFQAFIDENMKTSTYKALWKDEISQIDYEAAKQYKASLAEYGAAVVGSVISKNGDLILDIIIYRKKFIWGLGIGD